MPPNLTFQDKAVIVTGAAQGIGRTAARRFAEEGASVLIVDLDEAGARRTAAEIADAGGRAEALQADIASPDDNLRMVQVAVERFGGLDAAFLNAAWLPPIRPLFEADLKDFDRCVAVNLRGTYLGVRAAGEALNPNGAVVVASSTAGVFGWSENPAYSLCKHALVGLVKSAASAFAGREARINAICPGGVSTRMGPPGALASADLGLSPDALPIPPFRGLGNTEHIAELALFLASRRAAYVNGSVLVADGGATSALIY